jgi:hypothetical protein
MGDGQVDEVGGQSFELLAIADGRRQSRGLLG